jgi:transcriptional regulator with XRE-family HTH domain
MSEQDLQHARVIGEKLRAARQQRQMSLRKLADKADISASMLSRIETGTAYPSVRSIYSIAAALSVPVDYFFPEQGENGNTIPLSAAESIAGLLTPSEMREAALNWPAQIASMEPVFFTPSQNQVIHSHTRPSIELKGGVTWSRLTASAESDAEFLEVTYEPGATSGAVMSHHRGREFGLVMEGELILELGFEVHSLRAGDSIIFDASTPHRLTNKSGQRVRALWVSLNRS